MNDEVKKDLVNAFSGNTSIEEQTTSADAGAYVSPQVWAKDSKNWKALSDPDFPMYGGPGGKFVKVKDKCKTYPYCNQGDINALDFYEKPKRKKRKTKKKRKNKLTPLGRRKRRIAKDLVRTQRIKTPRGKHYNIGRRISEDTGYLYYNDQLTPNEVNRAILENTMKNKFRNSGKLLENSIRKHLISEQTLNQGAGVNTQTIQGGQCGGDIITDYTLNSGDYGSLLGAFVHLVNNYGMSADFRDYAFPNDDGGYSNLEIDINMGGNMVQYFSIEEIHEEFGTGPFTSVGALFSSQNYIGGSISLGAISCTNVGGVDNSLPTVGLDSTGMGDGPGMPESPNKSKRMKMKDVARLSEKNVYDSYENSREKGDEKIVRRAVRSLEEQETKHQAMKIYDKLSRENEKTNSEGLKIAAEKIKKFMKDDNGDVIDPKMYRNSDKQNEFLEDVYYSSGQTGIEYDQPLTDAQKERHMKYLKGSTETGNAVGGKYQEKSSGMESNVMKSRVEGGDNSTGEMLAKAAERRKKNLEIGRRGAVNNRKYSPNVQQTTPAKNLNETVITVHEHTIDTPEQILALVPPVCKVNGREFKISNGEETKKVRYENFIGRKGGTIVILEEENKGAVNEQIDRMKKMMGYNPNTRHNKFI